MKRWTKSSQEQRCALKTHRVACNLSPYLMRDIGLEPFHERLPVSLHLIR
ncbi:hypothetical protein [uncultured Cohaesibacter sp.]|nr:hypothetical protein [uncultured Cohaesibacter sp.]